MLKAMDKKERRVGKDGEGGIRKKRPDRRTREKNKGKKMPKKLRAEKAALILRKGNGGGQRRLKETEHMDGGDGSGAGGQQKRKGTMLLGGASGGVHKGGEISEGGKKMGSSRQDIDDVVFYNELGHEIPRRAAPVLEMPGQEGSDGAVRKQDEMGELLAHCKGKKLEPVVDAEGNVDWIDRRTEEEKEEAETAASKRMMSAGYKDSEDSNSGETVGGVAGSVPPKRSYVSPKPFGASTRGTEKQTQGSGDPGGLQNGGASGRGLGLRGGGAVEIQPLVCLENGSTVNLRACRGVSEEVSRLSKGDQGKVFRSGHADRGFTSTARGCEGCVLSGGVNIVCCAGAVSSLWVGGKDFHSGFENPLSSRSGVQGVLPRSVVDLHMGIEKFLCSLGVVSRLRGGGRDMQRRPDREKMGRERGSKKIADGHGQIDMDRGEAGACAGDTAQREKNKSWRQDRARGEGKHNKVGCEIASPGRNFEDVHEGAGDKEANAKKGVGRRRVLDDDLSKLKQEVRELEEKVNEVKGEIAARLADAALGALGDGSVSENDDIEKTSAHLSAGKGHWEKAEEGVSGKERSARAFDDSRLQYRSRPDKKKHAPARDLLGKHAPARDPSNREADEHGKAQREQSKDASSGPKITSEVLRDGMDDLDRAQELKIKADPGERQKNSSVVSGSVDGANATVLSKSQGQAKKEENLTFIDDAGADKGKSAAGGMPEAAWEAAAPVDPFAEFMARSSKATGKAPSVPDMLNPAVPQEEESSSVLTFEQQMGVPDPDGDFPNVRTVQREAEVPMPRQDAMLNDGEKATLQLRAGYMWTPDHKTFF